jgi:hypothetical protein
MRMRTSALSIVAFTAALLTASCSHREETSWSERWNQIKTSGQYAYYCSIEICDEIEGGYYPECDCWCEYDGDGGDEPGDGGGDDPTCDDGGDDVGGGCDDGGDGDGDGGGDDDGDGDDGSGDDTGDDDGDGCTLTQGYWKNHNELQTNRNQSVPWPAPYSVNDQMCGQGLLDIFNTRPSGEAWYILAHQFVAASLNAASGADTSGLSGELARAEELLLASCGGIAAGDRAEAIELSELLDAFNNGVIGPGHCHH